MIWVHFLIVLPYALNVQLISVKTTYGGVGELVSLLLSSACVLAWWHRSHRFLSRFMWTPIPSPVAAGTSGGSPSELRGLVMFLQPLTWQKITNRNEPPATGARSASVQWALLYYTTRGLIIIKETTLLNIKHHADQCSVSAITEHISSLCWRSSNCLSLFFFFDLYEQNEAIQGN